MQTAHNAWFRLYRISKQGNTESESSYQGPDQKKKMEWVGTVMELPSRWWKYLEIIYSMTTEQLRICPKSPWPLYK